MLNSSSKISPSNKFYLGIGSKAGYKGLRLNFNNAIAGGFEPGEAIGFSADTDPNSVAGFIQDIGTIYSSRGYGWVTHASARSSNPIPLNMSLNPRDRL